jgi:hypothetical protein
MLCFRSLAQKDAENASTRSLENAVENADEKTQSERRNENAGNAANREVLRPICVFDADANEMKNAQK